MFIGRKEELKELKERYDSNKIEMISILGRRRIGKSQLIYASHQDFDGIVISFECSETSYKDNLDSITELIKKTFDNEYLSFASLYDVLLFLEKEASKQKILFIIDEYPYMRNSKATDSEIKNAVDYFNVNNKNNPLKFILCGSSIDIMNILDDANMPLHGRFTKIIRLFPLNYLESSLFYEKASNEDKIKYYSVLGGVPYLLKQVDPNLSFDENIVKLFFSSNALLKNELNNQIHVEINKVEKASYILNIISNKTLSYSDILSLFKSTYPNGEIDYPLNKLLDMKVVEKIYIEQDNSKRKPYYRIVDNAIAFYYAFLNINFANPILFSDTDYYNTFILDKLNNQFIPIMFERIGTEFVALMNKNKRLKYPLFDLFPYIINDRVNKVSYQFDVVGKTKKGLINFECKFQNETINQNEVDIENNQTLLANKNFVETIFISKSKVESKGQTYYLEDMFDKSLL